METTSSTRPYSNQIEQITSSAANSKGVASIAGPTRPFGNAFNFSSVENMSEILRLQYESQMFSSIGKDNKTVVVTVGFSSSAFGQAATQSFGDHGEKQLAISLVTE